MTEYKSCNITPQVINEAFNLCIENDGLRAGICCNTYMQARELGSLIKDIRIEYEPYTSKHIVDSPHGSIIRFCNGSTLNIFAAKETVRGKRFNYLIVDDSVDNNIQTDVLKHLVREYKLYDLEECDNYEDLFDFAESELQAPLLQWQRDMLTVLCSGGTYIAGRIVGKKLITDIYKKWKDQNSENPECCPCEYTYDQIMSGIKED